VQKPSNSPAAVIKPFLLAFASGLVFVALISTIPW
jgi:hypothetical protein